MIKAEQMCVTNLKANYITMSEPWVNRPVDRPIVHTEALMPLEEIADLIFDDESKQADERVYTDRDEFEEDLADRLFDSGDYDETTDEEFDVIVKAELAKYEPYWKKVIEIRADV